MGVNAVRLGFPLQHVFLLFLNGEGCICWKQRANLREGSQRIVVRSIREKEKNWSFQRYKNWGFQQDFINRHIFHIHNFIQSLIEKSDI